MNIIFLGAPGSGKGTMAQKLMNDEKIPQISTGDMLRQAIKAETPLGLSAKRYIDAGELVPDEVVIGIVRERLSAPDCANGYILDGFPRTVAQAEALEGFAHIDAAVNLDVSHDLIVKRLSGRRVCLKCGGTYHISTLNGRDTCEVCGEKLVQRKDDAPETVLNRLKVYEAQTAPLVDFYRQKGILLNAPCENGIEENYKTVREVLGIA